MGKDVKGFELGDRCVADVGETVCAVILAPVNCLLMSRTQCENCFYCRRGSQLMCENFSARGVTADGGFAEYIV